jgi:DNA-binding CsgD family transcriptional regulator
MTTRNPLSELIQQLYAAPGTIDGWTAFRENVAMTSGSVAGTIPAGAGDDCLSSEQRTALLGPLVPHLRRAWRLHQRLLAAESASADLVAVLDASPRAVFLLGGDARVVFMNHAARRLTTMRDGILLEEEELRAAQSADDVRLRSHIAAAMDASNACDADAEATLIVHRPSGRRPLVVGVRAVSRQRSVVAGVESAAMVFVTNPEETDVPREDTLRALFDLTPAEAKLTRLLAAGATLTQAGTRLGIRRETIRTRVKAIFEKTGTHRQAELVRLVLAGTPRVRIHNRL